MCRGGAQERGPGAASSAGAGASPRALLVHLPLPALQDQCRHALSTPLSLPEAQAAVFLAALRMVATCWKLPRTQQQLQGGQTGGGSFLQQRAPPQGE